MDVEQKEPKSMTTPMNYHARNTRRRRRIICLSSIVILLLVILIIVILAFTVFKPKRPITVVNSVSLTNIKADLDIPRFRVFLNVTLNVDLSLKNPNKVGFKYSNSSAILKYRGEDVGEVPIPAGEISAGETLPMNMTLTILADRLLTNSNVYSDVSTGDLPLSTYTRISGKVRILFQFHVVSYATCDLTVNLLSRSVGNQTCHYRNKI